MSGLLSGRLSRVATGAVVGLAWSAALRAWMVELAGSGSRFTWWTVVLVLAPATVVGAVGGWSWARLAEGGTSPRWAAWSPLLLASAVAAPEVFRALVTTGEGSGALLVAGTGAAGAVVFSRRRWSAGRAVALVGWLLGVGAVGAVGTLAGPPTSVRVLVVCVTGGALVALLGVGLAVNHRRGVVLGPRGRRVTSGAAVVTAAAVIGLVLTGDRPWASSVGSSAPTALWAGSLAVGVVGSAVAALGWSRRGVRREPSG